MSRHALYVDAEFERYGRLQHRYVVVEVEVEVIISHHAELVAVDVDDERVEVEHSVGYRHLDIEMVNHIAFLFLNISHLASERNVSLSNTTRLSPENCIAPLSVGMSKYMSGVMSEVTAICALTTPDR